MTLEQAICRWVVETMQPFTAIEEPSFRRIFQVGGILLPIQTAFTLWNWLLDDFNASRHDIVFELKATCLAISLSLNVWTSKNHLAILGVIGHWITPEFKYQERVLKFCELQGM